MSDNPSQKIQPWKSLSSSSLAEDENPDFSTRNLRANEPTCSMGASVSKPIDRKTEYQGLKKKVAGDEHGVSNGATTEEAAENIAVREDSSDDVA